MFTFKRSWTCTIGKCRITLNKIVQREEIRLEKFTRLRKLIKGEFKGWTSSNISILKEFDLPNQSQEIIKCLENIRKSTFFARIVGCIKLKVYRQSFFSNVALYLALIFKKI